MLQPQSLTRNTKVGSRIPRTYVKSSPSVYKSLS